jgi:hypothetical protein
LDLLYPLSDFYADLQLPLPSVRKVDTSAMPPPYSKLLVHDRDMTPTLESAYGGHLHLRVLQFSVHDDVVKRLVALELDDETPVEMGAIKIYLSRLPGEARELVLERREPFGGILGRLGVAHHSRPVAFFQVAADTLMKDALHAEPGQWLYGRRNTLWRAEGEPLAQVVEILPLVRPPLAENTGS